MGRGGARKGAGRKPTGRKPLSRVMLSFRDAATAENLRLLAKKNGKTITNYVCDGLRLSDAEFIAQELELE